jgi:hypothetical protein
MVDEIILRLYLVVQHSTLTVHLTPPPTAFQATIASRVVFGGCTEAHPHGLYGFETFFISLALQHELTLSLPRKR